MIEFCGSLQPRSFLPKETLFESCDQKYQFRSLRLRYSDKMRPDANEPLDVELIDPDFRNKAANGNFT